MPSKIWIVSPSASVTIAFFQSGARLKPRPIRLRLPWTFMVFTFVTCTLNAVSIAWRICCLFACRATAKAYFCSPAKIVAFSVISGRTTTWYGWIALGMGGHLRRRSAALRCALAAPERLGHAHRVFRQEQPSVGEQVEGVEIGRGQPLHLRQVARAHLHRLLRLRRHDQRAPVEAEVL